MVIEIFAAGFIGGIIRALVGLSKYISATPSKKRKFRTDWLIVSLLSSGGLGLLAGVFIADDVRFALLAGYAGTDFVEGIFKIKMKNRKWE
jgi:fluoride ion exporter CrcB/FEX